MPPERRNPEPITNKPEIEQVFVDLIEARNEGRKLFSISANHLRDGGRLVVTGEPGVGKTSILQGAASYLERAGMTARPSFYDTHLAAEKSRLGTENTEDWTSEMWSQFNENMFESFGDSNSNPNLIELPAVGNKNHKDRGLTAFEKLCEEASEGKGPNTLFIFVAKNPLLQLWAGLLRQQIVILPPDQIFSKLKEHKIEIEGITKDEAGAILVRDLLRRTGQKQQIDTISHEEDEKIDKWLIEETASVPNKTGDLRADMDRVFKTKSDGLILPPRMNKATISSIFSNFGIDARNNTDGLNYLQEAMGFQQKKQIIYMEWFFRHVHKLYKNQAMIVHNPYADTPKVFDLNLLKGLL